MPGQKACSVGKNSRHFSAKAGVAFFVSLLLCSLLICFSIRNSSQAEKLAMDQRIMEKTMKVNEVLSKLLYKTQALAALVIQNDGTVDDFERVAAAIVDDPAILNILVAPSGVISKVYPLTGNEKAVGYSLFGAGEGNREAVTAMEKEQLVLGGPFNLVQGGKALVGRYPVWLPEGGRKGTSFWGLVSVTLKYPQVLEGAGLEALEKDGLAYEIWRVNPDDGEKQIIAYSNYYYNKRARYIEQRLPIFNAEWFFRLSPVYEWYQYSKNWVLILAGLGVSFLIAFVTQKNHDLKRMKAELENMIRIDPLTGIFNRKGLLYELEILINASRRFELYYIDLNYFKQINDVYGHAVGDRVLIEFCGRILKHADAGCIFARLSGDEFALARVPGMFPEGGAISFWKKVDREFACPLPIGDEGVFLSFSRGLAVFPENGSDVDELLSYADKKMYQQKHDKYASEKRRRTSDWQIAAVIK